MIQNQIPPDLTLQSIFDRFKREMLSGVCSLSLQAPIYKVVYSYDAWNPEHVKTRKWITDEAKIPYWILTDSRIHLLADLQDAAQFHGNEWMDKMRKIANEYNLHYVDSFR